MFNRLKDFLTHDGFLPSNPTDEEVHIALARWVKWVEGAKDEMLITH
jgi:hypothetical protein